MSSASMHPAGEIEAQLMHDSPELAEICRRAGISPWPSNCLSPATHSNMNCTPSRWWGLRKVVNMGSTSTCGPSSPSGGSHSISGSTCGGSGSACQSAINCRLPLQANAKQSKAHRGIRWTTVRTGSSGFEGNSGIGLRPIGRGSGERLPHGTNTIRCMSLRLSVCNHCKEL